MLLRIITKSRFRLIWIAVALLSAGCEKAAVLNAPEIAPARAALVTALNIWKAGRVDGAMIGSNPTIGIVDSSRYERSLIDYEILGSLASAEKSRPFAVRLVLDTPRETVTVRYVVLGNDPLWVFRQEDLDMTLHWEHKMSTSESGAQSTSPTVSSNPDGK